MPPFAGTEEEIEALAAYLANIVSEINGTESEKETEESNLLSQTEMNEKE